MDDERDDTMAAAERLVDKLHDFVARLDDVERPLMAALLAPGIFAAWNDDDTPPVAAFDLTWTPRRLPSHLCEAVRRAEMRISFAEPR